MNLGETKAVFLSQNIHSNRFSTGVVLMDLFPSRKDFFSIFVRLKIAKMNSAKRGFLFITKWIVWISWMGLVAIAQEVEFKEGSWKDIKELAKRENKPIFVDFYTDWCGWCKVMDKKTFKDPEVAKIANSTYIPYRINAEKGEGIQIAKTYGVRAFPTILFFSPEGEVIGKLVGYTDSETFIEAMRFYLKKIEKKPSGRGSSYNLLEKTMEQYVQSFEEMKKKPLILFSSLQIVPTP